MFKRLRNLRLVVLFINYLICLYALGLVGILEGIDIKALYKTLIIVAVSVLIGISGLILIYFKLNCNMLYFIVYTLMMVPIFIAKPSDISDVALFSILITVIMIAIFCCYLYIFERKIDKVTQKGASEDEIKICYFKYLRYLVVCILLGICGVILLYVAIQKVSAYLMMYLYNINTLFSIPAICGFIGVILVCIFLFVMFYRDNSKK